MTRNQPIKLMTGYSTHVGNEITIDGKTVEITDHTRNYTQDHNGRDIIENILFLEGNGMLKERTPHAPRNSTEYVEHGYVHYPGHGDDRNPYTPKNININPTPTTPTTPTPAAGSTNNTTATARADSDLVEDDGNDIDYEPIEDDPRPEFQNDIYTGEEFRDDYGTVRVELKGGTYDAKEIIKTDWETTHHAWDSQRNAWIVDKNSLNELADWLNDAGYTTEF